MRSWGLHAASDCLLLSSALGRRDFKGARLGFGFLHWLAVDLEQDGAVVADERGVEALQLVWGGLLGGPGHREDALGADHVGIRMPLSADATHASREGEGQQNDLARAGQTSGGAEALPECSGNAPA